MTVTEIITVAISIFALVVSIVAIALQYGHRDNTQFKVTKIALVSHEPIQEIDRKFAVVINLSVFNMGNKPVALESLELTLEGEISAVSDDEEVRPSSRKGTFLISPMSNETYDKLGFRPFVVPPGSITTEEIVFDLMQYEKKHKHITAKGNLELRGLFYNSNGKECEIQLSIAEIDIKAIKEEEPVYSIKFNSGETKLQKVGF